MDYWNGMESGMPRIGALPIGGMYVFDTVLEFDASDRKIGRASCRERV